MSEGCGDKLSRVYNRLNSLRKCSALKAYILATVYRLNELDLGIYMCTLTHICTHTHLIYISPTAINEKRVMKLKENKEILWEVFREK